MKFSWAVSPGGKRKPNPKLDYNKLNRTAQAQATRAMCPSDGSKERW